ncbi:MAG TPA: nuclear transport factor 2 family protein [Terriglobales bacterium]|nr:nuclear transport factor 2 family protein [Terriglobales bacterium]
MNLRLWLLTVLLVSTSPLLASPCSAYPAGEWRLDQASALQFEQTWLQVLQRKNIAALNCMLAAEFKDTSRTGVLRPKAQVLHELTMRRKQDLYQQNLTQMQANLFGDTAVVHGVNAISDQQGHQVLRIRFTDVLYFFNGRWFAVAAQETDEQPPQVH